MVLESTKCLGLVRYMTLDRQWLLIITKLVDVIERNSLMLLTLLLQKAQINERTARSIVQSTSYETQDRMT